jgi:hypothetical protein
MPPPSRPGVSETGAGDRWEGSEGPAGRSLVDRSPVDRSPQRTLREPWERAVSARLRVRWTARSRPLPRGDWTKARGHAQGAARPSPSLATSIDTTPRGQGDVSVPTIDLAGATAAPVGHTVSTYGCHRRVFVWLRRVLERLPHPLCGPCQSVGGCHETALRQAHTFHRLTCLVAVLAPVRGR